MNTAAGTFEVKINSLPPYNTSADAKLARMSIDKQFHGDLEGTSQGEMLSAGTEFNGSAGYVAIEGVTRNLKGRSGGVAFQHKANMTRGTTFLKILFISDLRTGGLGGV